MYRMQSVWVSLVWLGTATAAQALTIDVPLDAGAWFTYPHTFQVGAEKGTLTNNADGHLVATKTTATGGSNWFLGRDTVATYDLRGGVLQYQWKLDGKSQYSGTYNGLQTMAHAGLAYYKPMTTHHQYGTSILIPSNTWLYTEYKFSEVGHTWDYSISKVGYGGHDIAYGSTGLAADSWTALATARPFIWIGDNYASGAQFELARMTVTMVPEPGTMALLLAGLMGVGLMARRRCACR